MSRGVCGPVIEDRSEEEHSKKIGFYYKETFCFLAEVAACVHGFAEDAPALLSGWRS